MGWAQRSLLGCLLPPLREVALNCSNDYSIQENQKEHTHFHFIKIVYKYRAVGYIHSKALFWFKCNSTREKEKPLHSVFFNLYIQTPPMFLGSNFNPRIISSIIQGPGCQELKTHPGSGTLYDLALNYKLSCIFSICFPTLV